MSYLKKRDAVPGNGQPEHLSMAGEVRGKFEAIVEFLSRSQWDDGSARDPGTMLICTGEGRWRAWLNDRDSGLACWVSSDTLQGLLGTVEKGLQEGKLEWRQQPKKGGGRR
jgi:hypothetical protein